MDDEDQNSDVDDMMADQEQETDVDAASSVLSQSLRSSHSYNGGDPNRYYRYVYLFDKESQLNRLDLKLGKVESTGFFLCGRCKVKKSQSQMKIPSACNFIGKLFFLFKFFEESNKQKGFSFF